MIDDLRRLYLISAHKGSATYDFLGSLTEREVEDIHDMGNVTLWPMEIIVGGDAVMNEIMRAVNGPSV